MFQAANKNFKKNWTEEDKKLLVWIIGKQQVNTGFDFKTIVYSFYFISKALGRLEFYCFFNEQKNCTLMQVKMVENAKNFASINAMD